MKNCLVGLLLLLAGCGGGSSGTVIVGPGGNGPSNTVNGWTAYYSYGVSLSASSGALFSVAIPLTNANCPYNSSSGAADICPALHYLETPASGLVLGKTITVTVQVQTSSNAVFNGYTATDNVPNGQGHAPACRIWFQEAGDNLSGAGPYAYYRWWANDPGDVVLANGIFTFSATLNPTAGWDSVMGEFANNSAAATSGFQQAIANAASMGITCGGGSFYGHGVNMNAGSATLIIKSYTVQ